jgi:hypothetical protein
MIQFEYVWQPGACRCCRSCRVGWRIVPIGEGWRYVR